jgi:hypothetical protein
MLYHEKVKAIAEIDEALQQLYDINVQTANSIEKLQKERQKLLKEVMHVVD